jgi:hypothetical protein
MELNEDEEMVEEMVMEMAWEKNLLTYYEDLEELMDSMGQEDEHFDVEAVCYRSNIHYHYCE